MAKVLLKAPPIAVMVFPPKSAALVNIKFWSKNCLSDLRPSPNEKTFPLSLVMANPEAVAPTLVILPSSGSVISCGVNCSYLPAQ